MTHSNSWRGRWNGLTPVGDLHNRARTIVRHTGGIVRGKFPSRKNGRMVHHEGLLELDAIYHFEASPQIINYREQPTTIHYPDGAGLRRYTPDFELVLNTGKTVLIEVKPLRSLDDEAIQHKFACVSSYLNRSDTPFCILTSDTLRQEPLITNLKWLYHRAARIPPTYDLAKMTVQRLCGQFPLTFSKAEVLFRLHGVDPSSLLLAGLLRCSLLDPITPETQIHLATEADDDWFCLAQEYGF